MNKTQYLIYYDLSQEQIGILSDCLQKNTMLHDATACATDIIAIPALGVVINPTAMPKRDLEMILEYYKAVDWHPSELVIFTKKVVVPKTAKIMYLDDSNFNFGKVQTLLSQASARQKRNAGYHARIALCLLVLKTIRNRPGMSTKSIAEECGVSEKSVLRYIETLRVSGEWIDYDHQSRGWKLQPGINSFFV
jgi:biotin operon repressor